jgi:hypothetical protein
MLNPFREELSVFQLFETRDLGFQLSLLPAK